MTTRTGILSDKHMRENCVEYSVLPVGYANSIFSGNMGNPNLPGIKPPKYQRSAIKPASADVMAVSLGYRTPGVSADQILESYRLKVKDWVPPKIPQGPPPPIATPGVVVVPVNRGTAILKTTIGTQAQVFSNNDYVSRYRKAPRAQQLLIGSRFISELNRQGIFIDSYNPTGSSAFGNNQILRSLAGRSGRGMSRLSSDIKTRSEIIEELLRISAVRGANIELEDLFDIKPIPLSFAPQIAGEGSSSHEPVDLTRTNDPLGGSPYLGASEEAPM
jgi:hypothetical protein